MRKSSSNKKIKPSKKASLSANSKNSKQRRKRRTSIQNLCSPFRSGRTQIKGFHSKKDFHSESFSPIHNSFSVQIFFAFRSGRTQIKRIVRFRTFKLFFRSKSFLRFQVRRRQEKKKKIISKHPVLSSLHHFCIKVGKVMKVEL